MSELSELSFDAQDFEELPVNEVNESHIFENNKRGQTRDLFPKQNNKIKRRHFINWGK